jgi:predicted acyltransferase
MPPTSPSLTDPAPSANAALAPSAAGSPSQRSVAVDALRGFTMFWIVGGDELGRASLAAIDRPWADRLSLQLEHVAWEGFRFYDLIFPTFLLLVGFVIPWSLEKYRSQPGKVYLRLLRRSALLFLFGLLANGLLELQWDQLRVAGVLQRIAICYAAAALIYLHAGVVGRIIWLCGILLGYWGLLSAVPAPGGVAGDLSPAGNLAGYLDRTFLPGIILPEYYGFGDNEGFLSTLPAVATVLLGTLLAGVIGRGSPQWWRAGALVGIGAGLLALGQFWGNFFPVIKNLWTSSFVLVAGGWSCLLLALFYALFDCLAWRRLAFFWVVIGMNAITIYMLPSLIDLGYTAHFFLGGLAGRLPPPWGTPLLLAGQLGLSWLLLYGLYRQRLFLRL